MARPRRSDRSGDVYESDVAPLTCAQLRTVLLTSARFRSEHIRQTDGRGNGTADQRRIRHGLVRFEGRSRGFITVLGGEKKRLEMNCA